MAEKIPKLQGEVIGYRQWRINDSLRLIAAHKVTEWKLGDNKATCHTDSDLEHPKSKPVPDADCRCGFYGLHSPDDFWYGKKDSWSWLVMGHSGELNPLVSGIFVAWGNIEVHHSGFRSQYARVVALALPENERDQACARACAVKYGVPCVPLEELPRIAAEYGETIPEDLRPEPLPEPEPQPSGPYSNALKGVWTLPAIQQQSYVPSYSWNKYSISSSIGKSAVVPIEKASTANPFSPAGRAKKRIEELQQLKAQQNYAWVEHHLKKGWRNP